MHDVNYRVYLDYIHLLNVHYHLLLQSLTNEEYD